MKSLHNMINDYTYTYEYKQYNNTTDEDKKIIISQIIFLYSKVFPDNLDPDNSYIYWLDNNIFGTIFKNLKFKNLKDNIKDKTRQKLYNIINNKLRKDTNSGKNKTQLLNNIQLFLLEDLPYTLLITLLGEIYIQYITYKPKNNSFKTFLKNIFNIY